MLAVKCGFDPHMYIWQVGVFVNIKAGCICFGSTACVRFHHFRITQTRLGRHGPQEISNLIVSELPNSDRLREEALSAVMSLDQPKELFAHTRIIEAKQRLSNGRFCPRFRISGLPDPLAVKSDAAIGVCTDLCPNSAAFALHWHHTAACALLRVFLELARDS